MIEKNFYFVKILLRLLEKLHNFFSIHTHRHIIIKVHLNPEESCHNYIYVLIIWCHRKINLKRVSENGHSACWIKTVKKCAQNIIIVLLMNMLPWIKIKSTHKLTHKFINFFFYTLTFTQFVPISVLETILKNSVKSYFGHSQPFNRSS